MPAPFLGRPVVVVDNNGNQILPRVSVLSALPLAIQVQDTANTPGNHPMCDYLNGGAPILPTDYALFLPGTFTNGSGVNYRTLITAIRRNTVWFNWLAADTGNPLPTSFSAEAGSGSTQPYTTLTGGFVANDVASWNPEQGHTALAELTPGSVQVSTITTALAEGAANVPPFTVWWVPARAQFTNFMTGVGPLVTDCVLQTQNIAQVDWQTTVTTAIALARAQSPAPRVWVQGSATPTSGFFGNLNTLANAGVLPDGIVLLTEPATNPNYVTDLQSLVNQLRG